MGRLLAGLRKLFVVGVISGVCAVLALEVGLRVMGMGSDTLMRPDPNSGWVHIPNRQASVASEDTSLGKQIAISINSLGLRDVERKLEKPPGTYRIALLGDSFIEAQQVPLDSCVSRQLERRLDGIGGREVEVWNCGVAGYTTGQEWLYLRHEVAAWQPDLVVLAFLSGNDVADAVPSLATSLRNRPFFRLEDDSLVMDRSYFAPDPPGVGWVRANSRLFTWASTMRQAMQAAKQKQAAAAALPAAGMPADFQIYARDPDSTWALAWQLCERQIVATRDEARSQGAGFLLVSIANGHQSHAKARETWAHWSEWKDRPELALDQPERRLTSLARANGIDYLPLLPAFRAADEADGGAPRHIAWSGHWNSAGHALAAEVMAARIAAMLAAEDAAAIAR